MELIWTQLKDLIPTWLLVVFMLLVGVMRYGPKFIRDVLQTAEEWGSKSEAVKNEYIAMLKRDKASLQKEVGRLRKQLEKERHGK